MKSMTGFGQAKWRRGERALSVDVRSVNQRFFEAKLNMPREYLPWEAELRALVAAHVARGKVDVSVSRSGAGGTELVVEPNVALAKAYVQALRSLQRTLKLSGEIDVALLQGRNEFVRVSERRRDPSGDVAALRATLLRALKAFDRDRQREGRALARDMTSRIRRLQRLQRQMARRVRELKPRLAARLRARVSSVLQNTGIKEERLLQEVALLIERGDVTEELVRLDTHLKALATLMRSKKPVGKKIDFLLQEVHRESNTIASKSSDVKVTQYTLEARGEIEKLREQAQNVE
jgi:uncharacterized protein (TIGR00255 family)